MKFHFPVIIIDEDFRSENVSGLGIRALAKAIEEEGLEVLGVTGYGDLSSFAQQLVEFFRCHDQTRVRVCSPFGAGEHPVKGRDRKAPATASRPPPSRGSWEAGTFRRSPA